MKYPFWLNLPGATFESIQQLRNIVPALPGSYLECLSFGNGGEVRLRIQPLRLCLDSAESALDYWFSGTYTKQGVFIFGTSGGGDYFAFDLCVSNKRPVICFDPISPDDSTELIATSFENLLLLCEE